MCEELNLKPIVPCEGTIFRICGPERGPEAGDCEFFEHWMPVAKELDLQSLESEYKTITPAQELELLEKIGEHPVIAGIATGMIWTAGQEELLYFRQKGTNRHRGTILSNLMQDGSDMWTYVYFLGIVSALAHLEAKQVECTPTFCVMQEQGTMEVRPVVVCTSGWERSYAEHLKQEFGFLPEREGGTLKDAIDRCEAGKLDELFCKMVRWFEDKQQWQMLKQELAGGNSSIPEEKIGEYIRTLQMASTQDLTRHQESVIMNWFVENGSSAGDWSFGVMKELGEAIGAIQSNIVGSELQITDWKTRTPGFLARFLGQDALILANHPWSLFGGQEDAATSPAVVLENNDCIEMQFKEDVNIARIKLSGCGDYPISVKHVKKNGEEVEVKHTQKLSEKEAMIVIDPHVGIGSMELLRIYNVSSEQHRNIPLNSITIFDSKNEDSGAMPASVTVYKDGKPCGDFTSTANTALVSGDSNPLLITATFTKHLITLRSCAIIPSQGNYNNTDFILEVGDESSNWKSVEEVEYIHDKDNSPVAGRDGVVSRLCIVLKSPVTSNRFRLRATAPLTYFDIFGVAEKSKQ